MWSGVDPQLGSSAGTEPGGITLTTVGPPPCWGGQGGWQGGRQGGRHGGLPVDQQVSLWTGEPAAPPHLPAELPLGELGPLHIWGDLHHTFLFASLNWVLTPEVDSTLWRYNKLILYSFIIPGFLAFFGCSCFAPLVVLSPMVLLFYVFLLYYSTATTVAAGRPLGWDDSVLQGITKWVLFGSRPMRTRTQSVL